VICGKGNNGGDGFVVARKLHEAGKEVSVLQLADPADVKGDAAEKLNLLPFEPVIARNEEELKSDAAQQVFASNLLVDAILGTGFKPPVRGVYAAAIKETWDWFSPVVSVDIPSAVDSDERNHIVNNGARSDAIVTFTAPKPALVFLNLTNGPIIVASVGSPPEALTSSLKLEAITARDLGLLCGPRNYDANKGNFGHVLVIGGSRGKAGAVAMSGMAALRSGAGLCTIACPSGVQALVSGFAPELMTEDLAETDVGTASLGALEYGRIEAVMKGKTVLAIGRGVSRHPEAAEFVRTVVNKAAVPVVLDADGLNAFEGDTERLDGSERLLVLTPHPGEMARLTGLSTTEVQADRIGVARKFAREHNCVLVLKGWRTLVAEPGGTVWVNMTGNPGMATGGTGDVLTGIIAGFIAQHPPQALNAVLAAVYLHGLAGDLACTELGEQAMIATDLLRKLPGAFKSVDWNSRVTVLRGAAPQPFWSRNRARRSC